MSDKTTVVVRYQEMQLSYVIQEAVDDIKHIDGTVIESDWFLDVARNTVIAKMYVEVPNADS